MLTPNEFASPDEVESQLRFYEGLTNGDPQPFEWKFDREKLADLLQRIEAKRVLEGLA